MGVTASVFFSLSLPSKGEKNSWRNVQTYRAEAFNYCHVQMTMGRRGVGRAHCRENSNSPCVTLVYQSMNTVSCRSLQKPNNVYGVVYLWDYATMPLSS